MNPINIMYLTGIILAAAAPCGLYFGIGWITSTIILVVGIVVFFAAHIADVRGHEFEGEPKNFGRKNPYKAS